MTFDVPLVAFPSSTWGLLDVHLPSMTIGGRSPAVHVGRLHTPVREHLAQCSRDEWSRTARVHRRVWSPFVPITLWRVRPVLTDTGPLVGLSNQIAIALGHAPSGEVLRRRGRHGEASIWTLRTESGHLLAFGDRRSRREPSLVDAGFLLDQIDVLPKALATLWWSLRDHRVGDLRCAPVYLRSDAGEERRLVVDVPGVDAPIGQVGARQLQELFDGAGVAA